LLLKPTFCSFFLKEKVSVKLLLLLATFLKEVQEKVNLFVEFFFKHLATLFFVLLMPKKLLVWAKCN